MSADEERDRLVRIFQAGVAAADPAPRLRAVLASELAGRSPGAGPAGVHVLAVGKASARMASAALSELGDRSGPTLVVCKDENVGVATVGHAGAASAGHAAAARAGHAAASAGQVLLAGHPVPDARSEAAGRAALAFVADVPRDDLLLVLLSGGASSLLSCPAPDVERRDLEQVTRLLLGSGAPIEELNAVRKHLSATAGGGLGRARAAGRTLVLAVSDVPDDRIDLIGSGPFAPDPSTWRDAVEVLRGRGLWSEAPEAVRRRLEAGVRGELPDTPAEGDASLLRVEHRLLASNRTALEAASDAALCEGRAPVAVWGEVSGEARDLGRRLGALLAALDPKAPVALLAGGETTVTLRGDGRGGRSQELALAAALAIAGAPGVCLLAAGTDGNDGPTDAAGAFADGDSVKRGGARGVSAADRLREHDSYTFFDREGGLLRTGSTGTNVRDLVVATALPRGR